MNILVCVKQVPDTTEIKIDPVTNTLIRAGVPSIVNTFDSYALEQAVRLKEKYGGAVTVICMGPPQAKAAIRECLSKGADRGYLISGKEFSGSDTLATSYILARTVARLKKEWGAFDLILCGKQAIDGDTGQVGPEMAEHMKIAQVTFVSEVLSVEASAVTVRRDNEDREEIVQAYLPAVVTVVKSAAEPRFPSLASIIDTWDAEIPVITPADIETDGERIGLNGSPTKVKKTFTPQFVKKGVVIREKSPKDSALKLLSLMSHKALV